jgi:hypothetical protein
MMADMPGNSAMEIDYRDPQQFAVFIADEISAGRAWCARPRSAWTRRNSSRVQQGTEFDFIVVGAGSADWLDAVSRCL